MRTAAVACAVACLLVTGLAVEAARAKDRSELARSRSIGWYWRGALERGRRLVDSEHVALLDRHRENGRFWGSTELVGLLERTARRVAEHAPGAKLVAGELSAEEGGDIPGHRSHENGLDADLGFYLRGEDGGWVVPPRFVPVTSRGVGRLDEERTVTFDDAANLAFVEALLADRQTPVQLIFVANGIKRRLVREARRQGRPDEVVDKLERVLMQPGHGPLAHREHFHVRIYCPPADRPDCRDRGPYWRWLPPERTPNPELFRDLVADGAIAVPLMPSP